jgi:hypothetical protein
MCVVVPQRGAYSPPARRCSHTSKSMRHEPRSRVLPMKVFVTDAERARIEERAKIAGLSVSAYLRAAGLNQPIRSVLDHDAVRELAKINGDQGRLGGLLKLWLMEREGQGAPAIEVRRLLHRIGEIQAHLADMAGRV